MAENNLGQVAAVWINDSEPPHKNVLWLKTINQLTSEKAGFIWNGTEWINIQGLGFFWKGEFAVSTDYTKNDVVKFDDMLYIKLNDVVNNGSNPDVSADFDLFLPSATPSGVEGSVQIKDANGKFFGSSLLRFIAGLFSVYGSFFLKSNSSSTGNAFELKNSNNANLQTVCNNGSTTRSFTRTVIGVDNNDLETSNYNLSVGVIDLRHNHKIINVVSSAAQANVIGDYININLSGNPITAISYSSYFQEIVGARVVGMHSYNAPIGVSYSFSRITDDPSINNGWAFFSNSTKIGFETNCYPQIGGVRKLLRLNRFYEFGSITNGVKSLNIGEGTQISFEGYVALNSSGLINKSYADSIQHRVAVLDDADSPLTTEFGFKTTNEDIIVEPLTLKGKDVKQGYADGKQAFYGKEPISKQSLPQNATSQQILEALENLGLLDIIIP